MATLFKPKRTEESLPYAFQQNEQRANAQMSTILLGIAMCLIILWIFYMMGGFVTKFSPIAISATLFSISFFLVLVWSICGNFFVDRNWSKHVLLVALLLISAFIMNIDIIFSLFFFAATLGVCCRYYDLKFITSATIAIIVVIFFSNLIAATSKPIFTDSNSVMSWLNYRLAGFDNINSIEALFLPENKNYLDTLLYRLFVPEMIGISIVGLMCILIAKDGRTILEEQKEVYEKNAKNEIALEKSQTLVTISQIQPHFLFNSLNSIYYLCEKDPEKAQEAIDSFSSYLRMNIDTLQSDKLVPFEKELEHINQYLYLEKIRFDERLNTEFFIQTKDFLVPPLSIQPLVENAIKHGIGKKGDPGHITLTTKEDDKNIYVAIIDDGVGFDVNAPIADDGREHVGLINIKKRLKISCNANVNIDSIIGSGTTVTVIIPKENA